MPCLHDPLCRAPSRPQVGVGKPSTDGLLLTDCAGFVPTLEFAEADQAYATCTHNANFGSGQPGYYDNR